ncbi:four helix bundle protein [Candidatus Parcubacteria bacterium]|nr:four helix bundle protein [Candidatus Parcubacteria bacterium]
MEKEKIKSFEQLIAWQKSQDLAVNIYKITKNFPKEEQFALTNQIRRASTSISANIAEGFGRRTLQDKKHFYIIAYGSLLEVKNFVHLSLRLDYIDSHEAETIFELIVKCQKLVNALNGSLK